MLKANKECQISVGIGFGELREKRKGWEEDRRIMRNARERVDRVN